MPLLILAPFEHISKLAESIRLSRDGTIARRAKEGRQQYTPCKAVRIVNRLCSSTAKVCDDLYCDLFSDLTSSAKQKEKARSILGYAGTGSIGDQMSLCSAMYEQFKINHVRRMLSEEDEMHLGALLNRLILVYARLDALNTSYKPYKHLSHTQAVQEKLDTILDACQDILLEEEEIYAELKDIMENLGTKTASSVSVIEGPAEQPAPQHTPLRPLSALESVRLASRKCKSRTIAEKFNQLSRRLTTYMASPDSDQDLVRRLNTYYLPTLELAFKSLADAERKNAKQTSEQEKLCLHAISTVENILSVQEDNDNADDLRELQVEIQAMDNMARLKGDIPARSVSIP